MGPRLKYVRTDDDVIIIFPEYISHDQFKWSHPKSAGFISMSANRCGCDSEIEIKCFGESISLKLKSLPEEDSKIAQRQFGWGG